LGYISVAESIQPFLHKQAPQLPHLVK